MAPRESNEALHQITETATGRASQRSVVWYAAAAELRRTLVSLSGIAALTVLAVRSLAPPEWAVGGIVAICWRSGAAAAALPALRDLLGRKHVGPPPR